MRGNLHAKKRQFHGLVTSAYSPWAVTQSSPPRWIIPIQDTSAQMSEQERRNSRSILILSHNAPATTKSRSRSPQSHDVSSDPRRGRRDLALAPQQEPEPEPPTSHHQAVPARDSSSMSRGRTRRPREEYTRPPRDPAAYETSSAEEFVYPDDHGGFSARPDTNSTDNDDGDRRRKRRGCGPGRYQSRMLGDFAPRVAVPGDTAGREKQARERAAQMAREERESQQLSRRVNRGAMELEGLSRGVGRRRERGLRSLASSRDGVDSGCCIML